MGIYDQSGKPNKLTIQQTLDYLARAGFSGQALIDAGAIAMAESGLDANSTNTTTSGLGLDRGLFKINSYFHPEVSDSCAYDPQCAANAFFKISQGGKNFCQWCTYNLNCANPCNSNGPYKNNLATVQAAVQGIATPGNTSSSVSGIPLVGGALDTLKTWGEYVGIFLLALLFILAGFYLLNEQAVNRAVSGGVDAALKLTV